LTLIGLETTQHNVTWHGGSALCQINKVVLC